MYNMRWHGGKHQAKEKGMAPRGISGDGRELIYTLFSKKLIGKVTFERNKKRTRCEYIIEEEHSS